MNRLNRSSAGHFAAAIHAVESSDLLALKSIQNGLRESLLRSKVATEEDLNNWFFSGNLPAADGPIDQFPHYLLFKLLTWSEGMSDELRTPDKIPDSLEGVRRAVVRNHFGSAVQHSLAMRLDFSGSSQSRIVESLEEFKDFWLSPEDHDEQLFAAAASLKEAWCWLDPQTLAGLILGEAVLQESFQAPPLVFAEHNLRLSSAVRFSRFAKPLLNKGWICFTWVVSGGRFFFYLSDLPL